MRIYIVRHGQTAWNKTLRWQGNQDVLLDETGIAQVNALAEKLSPLSVSRIYSSPLKRAMVSAEILQKKINADIVYRRGLREIHLGEWEGLTTNEIIVKYGGLYGEWEENPAAQIGLGVENMSDLQQRAYLELESINMCETDDFIIVAHGTWARCLLCKLLNIPLENRMSFEVGNGGINVVNYNKSKNSPRFTVVTLNDVSHIEKADKDHG